MKSPSTSNKLIEHLEEFEGFRGTAWLDTLANPPVLTIGYGETLGVRAGDQITKADALVRLHRRIESDFAPDIWDAMSDAFRSNIESHEFEALVALAYNEGTESIKSSTLLHMLNRGERRDSAAEHFLDWIYSGGKIVRGLVRRRAREMRIFLTGY